MVNWVINRLLGRRKVQATYYKHPQGWGVKFHNAMLSSNELLEFSTKGTIVTAYAIKPTILFYVIHFTRRMILKHKGYRKREGILQDLP